MPRGKASLREDFINEPLDGLQSNPSDYMFQFMQHLTFAPDAELPNLGKALVQHSEAFLKEFKAKLSPEISRKFPFLLEEKKSREVFRALLESCLADELSELATTSINTSGFHNLSHRVLAVLGTHIHVYLESKRDQDTPLIVYGIGERQVFTSEARHTYTVMSLAEAHKMIIKLGDAFLESYVASWVDSDSAKNSFKWVLSRIRAMPATANRKNLFSQHVGGLRQLQSSTKSFRERLGLRLATVCQDVDLLPRLPAVEEETDETVRGIPSDVDDLFADYQTIIVEDALPTSVEGEEPGQEQYSLEDVLPPFVTPNLKYLSYASDEQADVSLDEIVQEIGRSGYRRCLLAAPPNGGKRRVQHTIAKHRTLSQLGFDLWIDLRHLSRSGSSNIYHYAARELAKTVGAGGDRLRILEDRLESLDFDGRILWHLEHWDETLDKKPHVASAISPLHLYLLSTTDPRRARSVLEESGINWVDGVIQILPFDEEQIAKFIEQYAELDGEMSMVRVQRLAAQLPGLAMLPGGIEHICENAGDSTIIDLLFDFINNDQKEMGQPPIATENLATRYESREATLDWGSPYVQAAHNIVKAVYKPGNVEVPSLTVEETARHIWWAVDDKLKTAQQWFDKAMRGRLLRADENDTSRFHFTVPEVGYLFNAFEVCQSTPLANLQVAFRLFQADESQSTRILLAFAAWDAEHWAMRSQQLRAPSDAL